MKVCLNLNRSWTAVWLPAVKGKRKKKVALPNWIGAAIVSAHIVTVGETV